jgi:cytochrome c553
MTKKSIDKDGKIEQTAGKPAASALRDEDLQQVSGGLAAHVPARDSDPVCISKL